MRGVASAALLFLLHVQYIIQSVRFCQLYLTLRKSVAMSDGFLFAASSGYPKGALL